MLLIGSQIIWTSDNGDHGKTRMAIMMNLPKGDDDDGDDK